MDVEEAACAQSEAALVDEDVRVLVKRIHRL